VDGRVQNLSGSIKELEQKKRDVNVTALDESVKAASYKLGFIKVGNRFYTGICLYGKSRKGQSSKT